MGKAIKIVAVGDEGTGKTALLMTYLMRSYPKDEIPPVIDITSVESKYKGGKICLELWDTSGSEDYDTIRHLCYVQTDVFLICFDVICRSSFERVFSKWLPQINQLYPDIPKMVVACKTDERERSNDVDYVTQDELREMANKSSVKYSETCAMYNVGIQKCMKTAIKISGKADDVAVKSKTCVIL